MRRNIWLKFDEWELINKELPDQRYNNFYLSDHQIKEWRKDIRNIMEVWNFPEEPRCFPRVGIYPAVNHVKSARALNILCREDWRPQDMSRVMVHAHEFIGFILTHCDDVNMDTTLNEWEEIRTRMNDVIKNSDKRIWFYNELVKLYEEQIRHKTSNVHAN